MTAVTESTATLSWQAPYSDGGSPITGYVIEKKEQYGTRWIRVNKWPENVTEFTVPELKNGLTYEFRVSAENKAGMGKACDPTRPTMIKPPYGKYHR